MFAVASFRENEATGTAVWDGRTLRRWVPDAVADVVRFRDPQWLILFGSVARGEEGQDSDIMTGPPDHWEAWRRLDQSVEDLRAADWPATDPEGPYEARRLPHHLAAEKALKGVLVACGVATKKIHDLVTLQLHPSTGRTRPPCPRMIPRFSQRAIR